MDRLTKKGIRTAMISEAEKKSLKIGFKEVMNIISENRAVRVIIADDCEDKIKIPVSQAAKAAGLQPELCENMRMLGKMSGIDVGASCAAVVKS